MRLPRFLAALLLLSTAAVNAQKPNDAKADVRHAVEKYLRGLRFNDTLSLRAAFWPEAKLYWVKKDGTLGQLSQTDWYKGFAGSVGKEEEGSLKITAVDVSGDVASVKVEETYPNSIYIDYLNLVKWNGEWRIVNKVYTSKRR